MLHRFVIFAAVLSLACPYAAALDLPEGARADSVGKNMKINGRPSTIRHFTVKATEQDVGTHFRRQFDSKVVTPGFPGFRVVAAREGENFHTVRYRQIAPGVVEGFVMSTSMRDMQKKPELPANPAWLPPSSAVISSIESQDGPQQGTTLVAVSQSSAAGTRSHVAQRFTELGYTLEREGADPSTGATTLWFKRPDENASVTIAHAQSRTTVVAHLVRSPQQP